MRFFDESTKNAAKETLVLMDIKDANTIYDALQEYVKNNPKKKKAKALLQEMYNFWGISI